MNAFTTNDTTVVSQTIRLLLGKVAALEACAWETLLPVSIVKKRAGFQKCKLVLENDAAVKPNLRPSHTLMVGHVDLRVPIPAASLGNDQIFSYLCKQETVSMFHFLGRRSSGNLLACTHCNRSRWSCPHTGNGHLEQWHFLHEVEDHTKFL